MIWPKDEYYKQGLICADIRQLCALFSEVYLFLLSLIPHGFFAAVKKKSFFYGSEKKAMRGVLGTRLILVCFPPFRGREGALRPNIAASKEGKLKEKLESLGLALLCLALAAGNPMDTWSKLEGGHNAS